MVHSVEDIFKNQAKFKNEIKLYLYNEYKEAKNELKDIKTEDEFILSEVKKLESKFKKTKPITHIDKLFLNNPNRSKEYYAWWDEKNSKALVIKYEEK